MNPSFPKWLIPTFALLLIVVLFSSRLFVKIDAGEAGVQYDLFSGLNVEKIYDQGLKIIEPWNKMYKYTTRM